MSVIAELEVVREGHTTDAVARLLGVTRKTVVNLIHRGELTAWLIVGNYRITPDSLAAYVEKCRPRSPSK